MFGRPDWNTIFTDIKKKHPGKRVGVFVCGKKVRCASPWRCPVPNSVPHSQRCSSHAYACASRRVTARPATDGAIHSTVGCVAPCQHWESRALAEFMSTGCVSALD